MSEIIKAGKTKGGKLLPPRELSVFCQQMYRVVRCGLLLSSGIQSMAEDLLPGRQRDLLLQLHQRLEGNETFAGALESTGAFPNYMINMVRIGEESGRLERVMQSLSTYYEQQDAMREQVKNAILYPSLLFVMMVMVLLFLVAKVLPIFDNVFHSLGTEMTGGAAIMLRMGGFLQRNLWFFVVLAALLVISIVLLAGTGKGRAILGKWLSSGKLSQKFALAGFASAMSLALSSGLDPVYGMELAQPLVSNSKIAARVDRCLAALRDGSNTFGEVLASSGLFPGMACAVITMGAKSGSLDESMAYAASLYEEEFENAMMKRMSLIEPVSVAILSVLIGVILLLVMLPLLGVMSTIG